MAQWQQGTFLVAAAPGAGKTRPALEQAVRLLYAREADRIALVCPTAPLTRQWAEAAARLVDRAPDLTAVFAASDNVALGVIGALRSSGRRVPDDVAIALAYASRVVVVPGYGLAVAQAQNAVAELVGALRERGVDAVYGIHPVAGRMPGHMNVLLAEANVPYEQLVEPGDVNPNMEMVDVAVVIGANDVVNPAAKEDKSSPLYGMPIIEVDRARTTFVLKRSMKPGFSGVENPLFYKDNTRMVFGDAKAVLGQLVAEFKSD